MNLDRRLHHAARELRDLPVEAPPLRPEPRRRRGSRVAGSAVATAVLAMGAVGVATGQLTPASDPAAVADTAATTASTSTSTATTAAADPATDTNDGTATDDRATPGDSTAGADVDLRTAHDTTTPREEMRLIREARLQATGGDDPTSTDADDGSQAAVTAPGPSGVV